MPIRDVFLCHAYVDKADYVRPLGDALARRAVSCWVDEAQIQPGGSIIDAIGEGLQNSRYVVVLITENFVARSWPQKELNAALSREISTAQTVVLPVLAAVKEAYFSRYPLLADKLYLDWGQGPEAVAGQIANLFGRRPSDEWHCNHPADFVGLVWDRVLPQPENVGRPHRRTRCANVSDIILNRFFRSS